jgi:hypothetical protein
MWPWLFKGMGGSIWALSNAQSLSLFLLLVYSVPMLLPPMSHPCLTGAPAAHGAYVLPVPVLSCSYCLGSIEGMLTTQLPSTENDKEVVQHPP